MMEILLPVANPPLPLDILNVRTSFTFMPTRLNTVLVVAAGAVLAAAVICGRSTAFKLCAVEIWVLIAFVTDTMEATRLGVAVEIPNRKNVFSTVRTGTVVETRDASDDTALLRAEAAPTTAVESDASTVCKTDTCADHMDDFVEMFTLRVKVAVDRPVDSAVSAFCNNDAVVEIAEFSDSVCVLRWDVAVLSAVLMDTSADCICETAVSSTAETDSTWLTRTGTAPEMALDSDASVDCSADTCDDRADDSDDTSVLRTLASDTTDCSMAD